MLCPFLDTTGIQPIPSAGRTETDLVDMVEAYALEHKLRPLRAVLTWKNRLTLYVEVPAAERNDEIVEWRWVRRLSIGMKPKLISMLVAWSICGCSSQESIHRLLIQFDAFRRAA